MRVLRWFAFVGAMLAVYSLPAQIYTNQDESKQYAETKQVNQFFRRFNGEEDEKGNRYYSRDKQYRSTNLRKKYLGMLFDSDNTGIKPDLKVKFAQEVLDTKNPGLLDFQGGNWFAEVQATFTANGKDHPVVLYMELEKDHLGSKWVISKVYADMYKPFFQRDTTRVGRFLHPLSHELDFMNLRKALVNKDSVSQFTVKRFVPDHLSLFLYEVNRGNLKFKNVDEVKFHFFQINGWYFELSDFNREGYNTGWLISNLVKINNESEKNILRKFLYNESP